MSFLMPKIPSPPPLPAIPPPPPAPPIKPVEASETDREIERQRRKRGISSTILTGPRGLTTEEAVSPTTPNLLAGD
jgi:hypothetical protein